MDKADLYKKIRLLQIGLAAMFVVLIGVVILQFARPTSGASSTATCLPLSKGGTGCDPASLRNYLGLGNTTGALPIANGGTGATTAAAARTNLGLGNIAVKNILDLYPVGSIYISTANTNPGTFLGGTWTAFGQGRTLLGIGSNAANSDTTFGSLAAGAINRTTAEERGGELSHTLTVAEMPSHGHNVTASGSLAGPNGQLWSNYLAGSSTPVAVPLLQASTGAYSAPYSAAATGGGGAHNNIQPYITVYFWKRTG